MSGFERFEPPSTDISDDHDSNINNEDESIMRTIDVMEENYNRQKRHQFHAARDGGRGRARYGRSKAKKAPKRVESIQQPGT